METEKIVSWMAIRHDSPVVDRDGNEVGHVEAVLGDDEDGIFHGLALNLKGWGGHVELAAERVQRITTERVYTDLAPGDENPCPSSSPIAGTSSRAAAVS